MDPEVMLHKAFSKDTDLTIFLQGQLEICCVFFKIKGDV